MRSIMDSPLADSVYAALDLMGYQFGYYDMQATFRQERNYFIVPISSTIKLDGKYIVDHLYEAFSEEPKTFTFDYLFERATTVQEDGIAGIEFSIGMTES